MVLVVHSVTDGEQLNVNLPPADHPLSTQTLQCLCHVATKVLSGGDGW